MLADARLSKPEDENHHSSKAIVIGAGPALKKFNHLNLLAKSKFKGYVFVSDVVLREALDAGVTPDKFPNYFVISVEYGTYIRNFYTTDLNIDLTRKYAPKITALLYAHETDFTKALRELGFNIILMEQDEYTDVFCNVGITGWWLAWDRFKCDEIGLIGINMSHGKEYLDNFPEFMHKLFFKSGYNEELKCEYVLDPLYQYFQKTFLEWLERRHVKTVNCTQEGAIEGPGVTNMPFREWLDRN